MRKIILRGFSKKFKGTQKLPAQKAPKIKRDPISAATEDFRNRMGDKPEFMGFSNFFNISLQPFLTSSKSDKSISIKWIFFISWSVKDCWAISTALLFERFTAITSHPNRNKGFKVFNPTPDVVPVIRTKPLILLPTSYKN